MGRNRDAHLEGLPQTGGKPGHVRFRTDSADLPLHDVRRRTGILERVGRQRQCRCNCPRLHDPLRRDDRRGISCNGRRPGAHVRNISPLRAHSRELRSLHLLPSGRSNLHERSRHCHHLRRGVCDWSTHDSRSLDPKRPDCPSCGHDVSNTGSGTGIPPAFGYLLRSD